MFDLKCVVGEYGECKIDTVYQEDPGLIFYEWPLLFTMSNVKGEKLIVTAIDDRIFLATPVTEESLAKMVAKEISIHDAFFDNPTGAWYIYVDDMTTDAKVLRVGEIPKDQVPEVEWPLQGAYLYN